MCVLVNVCVLLTILMLLVVILASLLAALVTYIYVSKEKSAVTTNPAVHMCKAFTVLNSTVVVVFSS